MNVLLLDDPKKRVRDALARRDCWVFVDASGDETGVISHVEKVYYDDVGASDEFTLIMLTPAPPGPPVVALFFAKKSRLPAESLAAEITSRRCPISASVLSRQDIVFPCTDDRQAQAVTRWLVRWLED